MDLRSRLEALEATAGVNAEEFEQPGYAVALNVALIEDRLIPLPPLPADLDVEATARLWLDRSASEGRRFVLIGGDIVTSADLWARHAAAGEAP